MTELIEIRLNDHATILVEIDKPESHSLRAERSSRDSLVPKSAKSFQDLLQTLVPVARSILNVTRELEADEIGIEFGVKLSADANLVIAKAAAESNIRMSLKWKASETTGTKESSNASGISKQK